MSDHTGRLRALSMAREAHKGQVDKAGRDYFRFHLIKVAKIVKERGGSDDAVTVAILHDILEDTDVTYRKLALQFGMVITDAVYELTKQPSEKYFQYIDRVVEKGGITVEVKIADTIDHLDDVSHISGSLIERYVKAAIKLGIGEEITMTEAPAGVWDA